MADTGGCHKGNRYGCSFEEKIMCKFHLVISNHDKLNLSDEQTAKIKGLKINTKKDLIKRNAEIDLISVDMKSKLWEDVIDKEDINKLIDQKYELKKAKTKVLINAYAELKNILTDEQRKKLKDIIHRKSPACFSKKTK
jgi:Spy/CpxP family protein refolding chaperone